RLRANERIGFVIAKTLTTNRYRRSEKAGPSPLWIEENPKKSLIFGTKPSLAGTVRRILSFTLLAFAFWYPSITSNAATITAASVLYQDVNSAVQAARDGDTVIIPSGMASWTSTLTITKGITLIGQTTTDSAAGTAVDNTIIQDGVTRGSGGSGGTPIIKVVSALGKSYRVSGLTFQGYLAATNNNGAVYLAGNSQAVRLDHCHFQPMAYQSVCVGVWGAIYGVADHNLIECLHTQCFSINMANWPNPDGSAGQNGNGSWATPTNLGSEKFFFIEDNCIKNLTSPWAELAANMDSTFGGRWVFRYNHCYETEMQNH